MIHPKVAAAVARLRERARQCRRAAFRMEPSAARSAMERIAARWDLIAEAETNGARRFTPANEA